MPKRRGHNEGSIYQRKRDGRWVAAVSFYDSNGRLKRRTRVCRTKADAKEALLQLLAQHRSGMLTADGHVTVRDYLERWLEDAARHSLRPSTFQSYRRNIRRHIVPVIGRMRLDRLTPADVQHLYSVKRKEGLSPRTVQYLHSILHRALAQAVKWALVPRNVCDAVDRPKVERKEMQVLTAEQAARLLEAAEDDRLHALYVLAVTTGMRQGELLGLTWEDVNLEEATIQVRRQLQYDRDEKRFFLRPTKNGKGRRIDLAPLAVEALRRHRSRQAKERLLMGPAWENEWNLVFTTQIGTPIRHENLLRRSFWPLLERAGLPRIRFHDLRHTAATLLLQAGEHPKVVQEMLGHSTITLTLDTYSHVLPSMQKAAAAKMQRILTTASSNP